MYLIYFIIYLLTRYISAEQIDQRCSVSVSHAVTEHMYCYGGFLCVFHEGYQFNERYHCAILVYMNTKLTEKKCQACEVGGAALTGSDISTLMKELGDSWKVEDGKMIVKTFSFPDFKQTMAFVNKVADLAEEEGHHPDMVVSYGKATIELSTHAVKGLSENDFILAAKIDAL